MISLHLSHHILVSLFNLLFSHCLTLLIFSLAHYLIFISCPPTVSNSLSKCVIISFSLPLTALQSHSEKRDFMVSLISISHCITISFSHCLTICLTISFLSLSPDLIFITVSLFHLLTASLAVTLSRLLTASLSHFYPCLGVSPSHCLTISILSLPHYLILSLSFFLTALLLTALHLGFLFLSIYFFY